MRKRIFAAIALGFCAIPLLAETITITKARQRYPWNGIVDIEYDIGGTDSAHVYYIEFVASLSNSAMTRYAWTNYTDVADGGHKIKWNATEALGTNAVAESFELTASLMAMAELDKDTGTTFQPGDYILWDILNRTITEVTNVTVASQFNTAAYKSTKMAFRKIPAGSFYMQGTTDNAGDNPGHLVQISRDYYMCIHELTRAHCAAGASGSTSTDYRPIMQIAWQSMRGSGTAYDWPNSTAIAPNSQIGYLNAKLPAGYKVDLATEVQWERAYRAGTRTQWFWGSENAGLYAVYTDNNSTYGLAGKGATGQRAPNAWGLYDMAGGVWEMCLDWHSTTLTYMVDPPSPSSGTAKVTRGGCSNNPNTSLTACMRASFTVDDAQWTGLGFRLVLTKEGN